MAKEDMNPPHLCSTSYSLLIYYTNPVENFSDACYNKGRMKLNDKLLMSARPSLSPPRSSLQTGFGLCPSSIAASAL